MVEHNLPQNYENYQPLDIQARGSKRPRYNNVDENYSTTVASN